jgi:hypothetical protein|uniref:DUF5053 domain-containing protein n=1 Tax=Siphoviridae sp. cthrG7 TaxID=2826428 RepID=A0A8S5MCA7_9CAUD|nr:MAG TPA: protein of unknown function (DUF5053) [Siphoviridae sp. cthrG7]
MGVKEEYFKLKEQWVSSRGSEREEIDRKLDAFLESLNQAEKELVNEAITEDFARIHEKISEAKELKRRIEVRKILSDTLPFISVSEFAKQYFNKSASWLHQRINGNEVHGKVATFTEKELNILSDALKDVADKLNNAATALS